MAIDGCAGEMLMPVSVAAVTPTGELPVTLPKVALMVVVPEASAFTVPLNPTSSRTVAALMLVELQCALAVRSWRVWSL